MILILLSWMLHFLVLVGLGRLILGMLQPRSALQITPSFDVFRLFWLGFCGLVVILQFVSLAFPLKGIFYALVAAASLAGLWHYIRHTTAPVLRDWNAGIVVFTILFAVYLLHAARLVGADNLGVGYDTDLYHLSVVRWAKNFPTVPGLALLHSRLGMSSSFLLYAAAVDHGPWHQTSAWIVQGLFIMVGVAQWLWVLLGDVHSPVRVKIFCLLSAPWMLSLPISLEPSLYYDKPALIMQAVTILELVRYPWAATRRTTMEERRQLMPQLVLPVLLAAGAFSIKAMGVMTLVGAFLLAIAAFWPINRPLNFHVIPWRLWLKLSWLPALLVTGLLLRNAILSGWVLYPAPIGRLPVSWAVPQDPLPPLFGEAQSMHYYRAIQNWARIPGPDCHLAADGLSVWFPRWWTRNQGAWEFPALGLGLLLAVVAGLLGRWRTAAPPIGVALIVTTMNLLQWFLLAPDLRFGNAFFWIWLALAGVLLWGEATWRRGCGLTMIVLTLLISWWIGIFKFPAQKPTLWRMDHARSRKCSPVLLHNGQHPPLYVWVPVRGDLCGDAPLPCTPDPCDNLCLRVPGNLRYGFYLAPPTVAHP